MPEVSLILPVYNMLPYLRECLDSILAQTFRDYEVIVVDDGSTDGSGEICDSYGEKDPRFRVVHQENGGLSAARNTGLRLASGRFVTFADSDDYLRPGFFETAVAAARQGYDMVFFTYDTLNENGEWFSRKVDAGVYRFPDQKSRLEFLIRRLLAMRVPWQVWNIIYDRGFLKETGIEFADNRKIFAEDIFFTTCLLSRARQIRVIPEALYVYRRRLNSLSFQAYSADGGPVIYVGRMSLNALVTEAWIRNAGGGGALLEGFYLVHYLFVRHELERLGYRCRKRPPEELRRLILEDVEAHADVGRFLAVMRRVPEIRRELKGVLNFYSLYRDTNLARYLADGNAARFRAERLLLEMLTAVYRGVNERIRFLRALIRR